MFMWDEAEKIIFLGTEMYSFGLHCALGALLALLALGLQMRGKKLKPGTLPLCALCMLVCGFAGARLLFCLLDQSLGGMMPLKGFFMVTAGGYSMVGALLGGVLGAALCGKISGQSKMRLAEWAVPAMLLFAACERLGEGAFTEFGVSRPLLGDLLKGTFLAVEGDYDWYLATYLLEAAAALILSVVIFLDSGKKRRPGDGLLLSLILYGGVQTVMESLRYDRHMSFSFVGAQHIAAIVLLGAAVIILACRAMKKQKTLAILGIVSVPLAAGVCLGLEFAIDRTEMNRYLLYAVYALVVAAPMYLGIRLRKEA